MNNETINLVLKVLALAGIVALVYFMFRKKGSAQTGINRAVDLRMQELQSQGMDEVEAHKQAITENRMRILARQKTTSIVMGALWIVFGVVFYIQLGRLDLSSIALVGLGLVQIATVLLIKPG